MSSSMSKSILVLGSNFAGYTAALELRERLGRLHRITVVSAQDRFVFMPSLIWLPFGLRSESEVTFPLKPVYDDKGIAFRHGKVEAIDLERRLVSTSAGPESYDYLVIATGPRNDWDAVPGLGPWSGFTESLFGLKDALRAREAFERFVEDPGPVVIGAAQGAACFGAAYEFLFNFAYQVKKRGLKDRAPLTFLTAEPYVGHFGLGNFGKARPMAEGFMKKLGIQWKVSRAVKAVVPGTIHLEDGESLPFKYAMLAPAFLGVEPVAALKDITTPRGFVKVDATYRTAAHPEVYAAGVAVQVDPPAPTPVPCGVPKTGYLSEEMAKVVAHNIHADLEGFDKLSLPPGSIDAKCVLDAGNTGIIMTADHMLEPRGHAWLIPGPEAHWAKLAFEKYFLATRVRGMV